MATKRDLVEAHSFSRRRLVTAFVSGAPGGREVEPARPGRTIVGGLALSVLLVAGAAIAGVFAPRTPDDWTKPGLVISKETGAAFVITEESAHPVLRPVINITSAKLILGADIEPTIISQETIDQQAIGDDVGILGAPASLPTPALLIDRGWTACTGDRLGLRVDVSTSPAVEPAPGGGFVVVSHGDYYLIAQARQEGGETPRAYRYRVPAEGDQQDNLLDALGVPVRADAVRVPEEWLALFPGGGDLDFASFGITGVGGPAPGAGGSSGLPSGARVGDIVTIGSESLLLTADGPVALDPFALAVYRHTETPVGLPTEVPLDAAPGGDRASEPFAAAHWPDTLLEPVLGEQCAQLMPAEGEAPGVRLATSPTDEASAADVPAGVKSTRVDPGRGAYVLSGGWDDTDEGSPFVVDAKGVTYPLVGPGAAALLGYAGYPVPVVPDSWVELFEKGVNLSQDAALCPPDRVPGRSCA